MNRRERRRAAKLNIAEATLGRVVFKPGADTSKDICFVCGKPATAWPYPERNCTAHGFVTINNEKHGLLCQMCFETEEQTGELVIRKYWNAPDMKVTKGGTYESLDQLLGDITAARAKPTN